jgi:hypothetical protein
MFNSVSFCHVFDALARRRGIQRAQFTFLYKNMPIDDSKTPKQMQMTQKNNIIIACIHSDGEASGQSISIGNEIACYNKL